MVIEDDKIGKTCYTVLPLYYSFANLECVQDQEETIKIWYKPNIFPF